jgi:hypothetical protein
MNTGCESFVFQNERGFGPVPTPGKESSRVKPKKSSDRHSGFFVPEALEKMLTQATSRIGYFAALFGGSDL